MRGVAILILIAAISGAAWAGQHNCTVPVTVVAPMSSDNQKSSPQLESNPENPNLPWFQPFLRDSLSSQLEAAQVPVNNLGSDAFVVKEHGRPVPIRAVKTVGGPRRIVFVVDTGKEVPPLALQIEAAVISDIVSKANLEDSFALLTARGPRVALGFDSSREAIVSEAQAIGNAVPSASDGESARATVIEATTWLRPSQPGDTIFLFALRLEKRLDVSFHAVREAAAAAGARVVGFQLGPSSITALCDELSCDIPYTQAFTLGSDSGGDVREYDTDEHPFPIDRGFIDMGEEMYRRATDKFYLLQVDSIGPKPSVTLPPSLVKRTPWVLLSYPRRVAPCPRSGRSQQTPCEIPVVVTAPDLSKFSQDDAAEASARWKEIPDKDLLRAYRQSWYGEIEFLERARRTEGVEPVKAGAVQGLGATAFVAGDEQGSIAVRFVGSDEGPHRIVFVVDNGRGRSASIRTLEATLLSRLLREARPEDSFALLTAHGPHREWRFGSSRASLQAAAETLAEPTADGMQKNNMVEALLEAATWLQPYHPGDAVLVLGTLDNRGPDSVEGVRSALSGGRIRLFWVQLGPLGRLDSQSAATLATGSGGWASGVWVFSHEKLKQREADLMNDGLVMYIEATHHYLVQFDRFGADLSIQVAPDVRTKFPWVRVRYPHFLPPCSDQISVKEIAPRSTN
jgi:hypothetical protein